MKYSNLMKWMGRSGLAVVLGGCIINGGDDTLTSETLGSGPPLTSSDTGATMGETEEPATDTGAPMTSTTGGEDTTGGPVTCDPPCAADEVCLEGECFPDGMSDSSSGEPPAENSDYGPCDACAAGEMPVQIMGIEGCFCSPMCDGMMCPAANEGTGMPLCALETMMGAGPTQCALTCMVGGDDCPAGATCQDTGMGVGLCTHPAP